MCCGFQKSTVKLLGWVLSLGFLVAAVVCIILAGVNFNTLFTSFKTTGGWQSLAAVEIASIVYVLVLCGLGVLTFCCDWWCLTLIFAILILVSAVFTGAIAIFGLVGGSVGKLESYLGCATPYTGVLDAWNNIDNYLQEVDQSFCGQNCICQITTPAVFSTSTVGTVAQSYNNDWLSSQSVTDATAFTNCTSNGIQTSTLSKSGMPSSDFSQTLFATYWGAIENKFKCTGFCKLNYTRPNGVAGSPLTYNINKYLFSNINNGVPVTFGCMSAIFTWLPPILNGFGAIALVVTALEVLVFLLALSLCCSKDKSKIVTDKQ